MSLIAPADRYQTATGTYANFDMLDIDSVVLEEIVTLSDFKNHWNLLQSLDTYYVAVDVVFDEMFVKYPTIESVAWTASTSFDISNLETFGDSQYDEMRSEHEDYLFSKYYIELSAKIEWLTPEERDNFLPGGIEYVLVGTIKIVDGGWGTDKNIGIIVPIHVYPVRVDGQGYLIEESTRSQFWRRGSFDNSFPELDAVARDVPSPHLSEIEQFLENQSKIEASGAKILDLEIPASSISIWGNVALASCVLYLMLHAWSFYKTIDRNATNWDFPWIGIYNEIPSIGVAVASISIVPSAISLWLLDTAINSDASSWGMTFTYLASIVTIFSAISLIVWRIGVYRTIRENSSIAQP